MISFPTPIPGEPVRISATLLVTYQRCPGEAEGRLRGVFGEDSVASFTGALLHRVLRRHLEDGPIEPETIPHVCRVEIGQGNLSTKMNAVGLGSSTRLEPVFRSIAEKYERFQRYPQQGFSVAEQLVEVEAAPDVTLVGKIDAVFEDDAGLRLVDWKSGGLGDPRAQLGFYALLWTLHTGEMPVEIEVVSLGTGERHSEAVTEDWLTEVASDVSELASVVRRFRVDGVALPLAAGPWCGYCPLNHECSEGQAALALLDGSIAGHEESNDAGVDHGSDGIHREGAQ
ncbi:MAG TPA: PD-(D/E)XK nuclease family protein [Acidimicrobiia bacterium]|jgi:hypothetical protein